MISPAFRCKVDADELRQDSSEYDLRSKFQPASNAISCKAKKS